MAKSPDAFRTISEVSEWLDTPAHVLRFWESKFPQIRPVKRAGGRRYYRPEDMALLGGIKTLLHEQGMTIKGVQKLLREQGVRHVAALGPQPLEDMAEVIDAAPAPVRVIPAAPLPGVPAPAPQAGPAPEATPPARPPILPETASAPPPPETPAPRATPPARQPDLLADLPPAAPPRRRRALPDLPPEASAEPGILSAILGADPATLSRKAPRIAPVAVRLAALRDRLRAAL